jgi:hypothetical protein
MRITIRRMKIGSALLAVAVTAALLPLAAGVVWLQSPDQVRLRALISTYEVKAVHHAERARKFERLSKYSDDSHGIAIRGGQLIHIPNGQDPELVSKYLELAKYHGALREKYENAAWNPRLLVEPDPPPPEP